MGSRSAEETPTAVGFRLSDAGEVVVDVGIDWGLSSAGGAVTRDVSIQTLGE